MQCGGLFAWILFVLWISSTESSGRILKSKASGGICMTDLGCFPITSDFFHPLYRPINFTPADKEKINTKFLVYTRNYPKTAFQIQARNKNLFQKSKFDVTKKTKVIVHGYIDNQIFGEWMREMKDDYLLSGDMNVILVDWSGGNGLPYTQATANTRVVGAEIAFLIQWLKDSEGLKLEDCHILGHSLGAHVAGYAGERLKKLGRITGMDPAEPFFQNLPPSVRLDPTDADFVDVIHTDSYSILLGGLGMAQLVGHVDFFPNAGAKQPGCSKDQLLDFFTEGLAGGARAFVACNHQRSVNFARDAINHHLCLYTGFACPDWETFLEGKCASCGKRGDDCSYMGEKTIEHFYQFRNDTRQRAFYLRTGPKEPYCLYHYQVTISLQSNVGKDQEGTLSLSIRGTNQEEKFILGDGKKQKWYQGASYTFLVTTDNELGEINSATFSWNAGNLLPWPKKVIYLQGIKIVPMNTVDASSRNAQIRSYCATGKNSVESKKDLTFYNSDLCKS